MKRVLIKLSGEALRGEDSPFSLKMMEEIGEKLQALLSKKIQISLVVGGGNVFRGRTQICPSFDRCQADHIGMLATVMNGLALQGVLGSKGIRTKLFSALPISGVCDAFDQKKAIEALESGHVVICVAGSGTPYFTTDTAAVLRALELKCDAVMKATKVDGVYDCDPCENEKAKRFDTLSYAEVISSGLQAMDLTSISLAAENKLPIFVFSLWEENCFERVLNNEIAHTVVS